MNSQLARIRKAYDRTVEQYNNNIDPLALVPENLKNSRIFREFIQESGPEKTGSNAPEIVEFLDPQPGMNYLDCGCCANLANYRLDLWPSVYFGVDISPALIGAMQRLVRRNQWNIGGLSLAELSHLPYKDSLFDMATIIGVFEYFDITYIQAALTELRRVLKSKAKMVVDFPNENHPHYSTMLQLEEHLGRPNIKNKRKDFENVLSSCFTTVKIDDSRVTIKYFAASPECAKGVERPP